MRSGSEFTLMKTEMAVCSAGERPTGPKRMLRKLSTANEKLVTSVFSDFDSCRKYTHDT